MYGSACVRIADIQSKLGQQLRVLEEKLQCQVGMVCEVSEFFKKRAEIELDYSGKLDKLAKHFMTRQKAEKTK